MTEATQEQSNENKPAPVRYVSLSEHEELKAAHAELRAEFVELVKHVQVIRFNGPSIELPDDLQIMIGLKVKAVEEVAE